jgi:hypothetical protein
MKQASECRLRVLRLWGSVYVTCYKIAAVLLISSVAPLQGQAAPVITEAIAPPFRATTYFEATPALNRAPISIGHNVTADSSGMPAWLKWGLIGGAATAAAAALLSTASVDADPPSMGESAVYGFAVGFVAIGGGVAVYQAVCKPGGWSKEHGLCDP